MRILKEYLGVFNVKSGRVIITDPCYEIDLNLGLLLDAIDGKWEAYVSIENGDDVVSLKVIHQNYNTDRYAHPRNFDYLDEVSIDSGQLAICDLNKYKTDPNEYEKYCQATSSPYSANIVENYAVVSSTGFGDGEYTIQGAKKDGKYYGFMVNFINDHEDDDDDWQDW